MTDHTALHAEMVRLNPNGPGRLTLGKWIAAAYDLLQRYDAALRSQPPAATQVPTDEAILKAMSGGIRHADGSKYYAFGGDGLDLIRRVRTLFNRQPQRPLAEDGGWLPQTFFDWCARTKHDFSQVGSWNDWRLLTADGQAWDGKLMEHQPKMASPTGTEAALRATMEAPGFGDGREAIRISHMAAVVAPADNLLRVVREELENLPVIYEFGREYVLLGAVHSVLAAATAQAEQPKDDNEQRTAQVPGLHKSRDTAGVAPQAVHHNEAFETLGDLWRAMRDRHYGRMPEEVQKAYDKAGELIRRQSISAPSGPAGAQIADLAAANVGVEDHGQPVSSLPTHEAPAYSVGSALLPCPFCGGEPREFTSAHGKIHGVDCTNCAAQIETVGDFATSKWNRRAAISASGAPTAQEHK